MLRLLFSVAFLTSVLSAQFGSGIQGTVADRTAAVVPGARVVVTNVDTGVSRETTSNDEGVYRVLSLSAGTYRVAVMKEGFGAAEQASVTVGVSETRRVDFSLTVGSLVESVTVNAQPLLLVVPYEHQAHVSDPPVVLTTLQTGGTMPISWTSQGAGTLTSTTGAT